MNHHEIIEKSADEAWAAFCKNWKQVEQEAGKPTNIEIWHHGFRAGIFHALTEAKMKPNVKVRGCGDES